MVLETISDASTLWSRSNRFRDQQALNRPATPCMAKLLYALLPRPPLIRHLGIPNTHLLIFNNRETRFVTDYPVPHLHLPFHPILYDFLHLQACSSTILKRDCRHPW
jgi:hypothetical protein